MEDNERYGITDAHYLCDSAIFNTETNEILRLYQICDLLNTQDKQINELKQQLAEKDKEIERLDKQLHTANQETLHFQNKYFAENQIAIEQLEKVKNVLNNYGELHIRSFIDQQIQELRGEDK